MDTSSTHRNCGTSPSSTLSMTTKRPISFGNPALGTYKGFVYTFQANHNNDEKDEERANTVISSPKGVQSVDRMVAMTDVPPEQVPEGILHLARSHRPMIEHVRIVIQEADENEKGDGGFQPPSSTSLKQSLSSDMEHDPPHRSYLVLFHLSTEEDAQEMMEDLDGKPYTSLDETKVCRIYTVVGLEGEGGVSLLNPMFAPATSKTRGALGNPHPSSGTEEDAPTPVAPCSVAKLNLADDPNCPVCLEHMPLDPEQDHGNISILTTVCNHTFHLDCLMQCQDSPCPVCRYDHSGLNEALSQCHICGSTERNYVCLICGVVSCVGNTHAVSPARLVDPTGRENPDSCTRGSTVAFGASRNSNDPPNANRFFTSHAYQHYEDTLHAYALDTETQHCFDFAGNGYIHRIVQNKDDGKLVEINDPNNTSSQERSTTPGLSDTQEDEVVHRKLEGFASQYYTLLKSQLEQQRTFYEGRLEEIRREFALKKTNAVSDKADLVAAMKQEKKQLSQQLASLKRKKEKVIDDVSFLKNMNESLESNKAPLERKIQEVQRDQIASREMLQRYLPALEEKVTKLMLQLEESMRT